MPPSLRLLAASWLAILSPGAVGAPNSAQAVVGRASHTPVPYQVQKPPLDTDYTSKVGIKPWPQYPRPQLQRAEWKNLNGIWTYQPASDDKSPSSPPVGPLASEILVPSCIESGLSGIQTKPGEVQRLWLRTTFGVPSGWNKTQRRILLNFEAVDYEATVWVNQMQVGFNRGGYFRFSIDVTDVLKADAENELVVYVFDPTDADPASHVIPRGKQTVDPSHIWYTPCTGIWQTVWLETVPINHITRLDTSAGADGTVNMLVQSSRNESAAVKVTILDGSGSVVATAQGSAGQALEFKVDKPNLWWPQSPTLYNMTVQLDQDTVSSYTGFRTIAKGKVNGVMRPLLNGQFVFQFGTLDQGFWPDGIYLAPTLEALRYDIEFLKSLGMNMVRKHIKIEPDLFYQACDQLGLLVFQDMPSVGPFDREVTPEQQAEFRRQFEVMIQEHKSYPSIVTWVVYNEGWGQNVAGTSGIPEPSLVDLARSLDPTRLVDATTGWNDHGYGDFSDNHHYAAPQCGTPFSSIPSRPYDPARIGFQGEFGGVGEVVPIEHLWNVQKAIDTINQTYEIAADLATWNYRGHWLLAELADQVKRYACSGAIWTETTDVEGEVNGLLTYDRRVVRPNLDQWKADIKALYDAAQARGV